MKNRVFILTMVVVVAIFLGVTMTVQQTNSPVMRRIVQQQTEILNLQKKIDRQLTGVKTGTGGVDGDLSQRLAALEKKIDDVHSVFKNIQARGQQRQGPPPDDFSKVHAIDIGSSYIKGKADAPITIVEFMDVQCPFCARFHPVLDAVVEAYPDKVKYISKHFPLSFHQQARPAAKAALAAGEQGKYWEMMDLLLKNQRQLTDANFEQWAKDIGVNVKKFLKDYKEKDAEYEKIIQQDMQLGQKVSVRGTPTFYLNGRKTRARDLATFKREIDAILQGKDPTKTSPQAPKGSPR